MHNEYLVLPYTDILLLTMWQLKKIVFHMAACDVILLSCLLPTLFHTTSYDDDFP